jgi:phytoene synthase
MPRIVCLEWLSPLYVGGHWVPEMVDTAGGLDALGYAGEPSRQVTMEEVRAAAPDILIVMPCGFSLARTLSELTVLCRSRGRRGTAGRHLRRNGACRPSERCRSRFDGQRMPHRSIQMTMTSAAAQAYCTTLTKQSGSNFYYSFVFLPKVRREAMYTVYAFCKAVDSAVDEPPPGSDPKEELRRWRSELDLVYAGEPTWPLMISLAHHAKRLSIPKAYFEELIKGVEMDLTTTRYRTFEELSLYCYRVASIVGLICLHIFGPTSAHAQDYAVDLGMAFQLTNILRDLATDADQGRIYLPQEDLARFGCSEAEFLAQKESSRFPAGERSSCADRC